jgi:hypothetical protein
MTGMNKVVLALATVGLLSSGAAQAALVDRGGGLLYDNVLNVTWLQDANYANTSGYAAISGGLMDWNTANTWAANLSYHDSVRNVDYSDWRLASNTPVNGTSWNYNYRANGTTDVGYNIKSPNSELAYMYYENLGLKGYVSATGNYQPDFGVPGAYYGGQADVAAKDGGPVVKNLQSWAYWSGTAYAPNPTQDAWLFLTFNGDQGVDRQYYALAAWAVRPGDVAAMSAPTSPAPEPETYAMLLAGLGLMSVVARRRKAIES